jgi:hypothetical protein
MIRLLMVGYNGPNNTGVEVRLLSDIEDVPGIRLEGGTAWLS